MKINFSPPDITKKEISEVINTLKSGWITTGPKTKKFENEISKYCGTNRTVCLNSATAGLELTLRILGIGEGDEVITSAYTFTASASVIEHVGAKIVLIDTSKNSYEMDYESLEKKINKNTKAIIAVDIGGVPCDYDKIFELVNKQKPLFHSKNDIQQKIGRCAVISDACHSFGSYYKGKVTGAIADFTCFSFHAVKNLTTGEGGAVTWNNKFYDKDILYSKFMLYALHGQNKDALAKSKIGGWEYDIEFTGYKFNMTDIMASLGLVQLKRYRKLLKKRKSIVEMYNKSFINRKHKYINHFKNNRISSYHLYIVRLENFSESQRNNFIKKMAIFGIPFNVHYKPLPMFNAYKKLGFKIKDYPNAFDMYKNSISFPLHTKLTNKEVKYILKTFWRELQ